MKYDIVKVAAATPQIRVADTEYNTDQIIEMINKAHSEKVKLLTFPEFSITGYTLNDLFLQDTLLSEALVGLKRVMKATAEMDMVVLVGLPLEINCKLYNVAAVLFNGKILGIVPKTFIPNYSEFYEARQFSEAPSDVAYVALPDVTKDKNIPFGTDIIFEAENMPAFKLSIEICEDLWVPLPMSTKHSMAGATIIANLSASDEITGKSAYRHSLVAAQSASTISTYIYADAGEGESTTDLVFSGDNMIYENGTLLAKSKRFSTGLITAETDLGRLHSERRRIRTFSKGLSEEEEKKYVHVGFNFKNIEETQMQRHITRTPFVPENELERNQRAEEILNIQANGLKKRLLHTNAKSAVVGISGGLDSTLALLVTAKAFELLNWDKKKIIAITMPCFGTTDRTYQNACELIKNIGATFKEIPVNDAVRQHFKDIEHDESVHDVTYENSQARIRTLVLMDVANKTGGLVIGTGDLSEIALGWATYNGDHMSMYAVNCSIPKTLVRYLVKYVADNAESYFADATQVSNVLLDILDTPVSPELLPPENGEISQETESLVGPYELHDFFLYYMMRYGYRPKKIYHLAKYTFKGSYSDEEILKWLKKFYWRFFSQQFKRSCIPDGPKVGSVALSPRGDWRMPSDACVSAWMKELE